MPVWLRWGLAGLALAGWWAGGTFFFQAAPSSFKEDGLAQAERPGPALGPELALGQPLPPTGRMISFLSPRLATFGRPAEGRVELLLLRGDRPPVDADDLRRRFLIRRLIPAEAIRDNQTVQVDLGLILDRDQPAYLILRRPAGAPAGAVTAWLSRAGPWPEAHVLTAHGESWRASPAWGHLAVELGFCGSRSLAQALAQRAGPLPLALGLLLAAGLAAWLLTWPASGEQPRRCHATRAWVLSLLLLAAGGLGLHLLGRLYHPFLADDALISLRYVDRLLAGQGLTWTDGERVEGYSNLLWVLATAGLSLVLGDQMAALRALGFLAGLGGLAAVLFRHRPGRLQSALAAGLGLAFLATARPSVAWSVGGLEPPLTAALLAWTMVLLARAAEAGRLTWPGLAPAGLAAGLLCLTRPDGALLAGTAGLGLLILVGCTRPAIQGVIRFGLWPAAFVLGQLAFRLAYYGQAVPNTALVKLGPSLHRLGEGLAYLGSGLRDLWPVLVLLAGAVGLLLRTRLGRRRATFLLLPGLAWAGYWAALGGDHLLAHRHLVPLLAIMALLLAEAVAGLGRRAAVGLVLLAALAGPLHLGLQHQSAERVRELSQNWVLNGRSAGLFLKAAFGPQRPLLAVDAAGCLPYFSGLPALDMLGLTDAHLASHRPPDFGQGELAHELGDGGYVLSRSPDLVLFCGPVGRAEPCFRSGREMLQDQDFPRLYRRVVYQAARPYPVRGVLWVRRDGSKTGPLVRPGEVFYPPWLIDGGPQGLRLDGQDRPYWDLYDDLSAQIELNLPAGRWRLAPVEEGGPSRVAVLAGHLSADAGPGEPVVELVQAGQVRLVLTAPAGATVKLLGLLAEELN